MFGNKVESGFFSNFFLFLFLKKNPHSTRVKIQIEFQFHESTQIPMPLFPQKPALNTRHSGTQVFRRAPNLVFFLNQYI
jgi:hypothetical protein